MSIEIEAKLKVRSLKRIAEKLSALDAEFIEEQHHRDIYFDDAALILIKSDRCLRLRESVTASSGKAILTYKGAKQKGRFKTRQEIEVSVSDFAAAQEILSALGYKQTIVIEKKRHLWRLGGCEIALDEVAELGKFVEIEAADEKSVAAVQKKLGLSGMPNIHEGYAWLMAQKLPLWEKLK